VAAAKADARRQVVAALMSNKYSGKVKAERVNSCDLLGVTRTSSR
jgi:hypothetical protein